MSFTITQAFVSQYKANVTMLYQQNGSKLRGTVREESLTGKAHFFERIGATAAQVRVTRHGDTPLISTPHSRRMVTPLDYEWADLVDQQDKIRILINPESEYAQNASMALGRAFDSAVIAAFNGNAFAGDSGQTTVALPSSQLIVNGGTGFTMAKLRQAKLILDNANVPDEERYLVYSPRALYNLLGDTQVTSADFNSVKALVDGQLDTYLGFKFVKTTLLPLSGNIRSCFAYHKNAMGIAVNADIMTRINERPDKSYAVQVYVCGTWGATRIQEEGVVQVDFDESV
jgi:hypothetical protein